MSKEVIVIAGLASSGANIAPLKMIAETISDDGNISYVDGAHENNGILEVSGPAAQTRQAFEIIDQKPDKDFVLISQSMGAIAALNVVESGVSNIQAVSIAPPLPFPGGIMRHPRLLSRLRIVDESLVLPSYSFALGDSGPSETLPEPRDINFPTATFDEIDSLNGNYLFRTYDAMSAGKLKLIIPTQDWNTDAGISVDGVLGAHMIEGPHSLHMENERMQAAAEFIATLVK